MPSQECPLLLQWQKMPLVFFRGLLRFSSHLRAPVHPYPKYSSSILTANGLFDCMLRIFIPHQLQRLVRRFYRACPWYLRKTSQPPRIPNNSYLLRVWVMEKTTTITTRTRTRIAITTMAMATKKRSWRWRDVDWLCRYSIIPAKSFCGHRTKQNNENYVDLQNRELIFLSVVISLTNYVVMYAVPAGGTYECTNETR